MVDQLMKGKGWGYLAKSADSKVTWTRVFVSRTSNARATAKSTTKCCCQYTTS